LQPQSPSRWGLRLYSSLSSRLVSWRRLRSPTTFQATSEYRFFYTQNNNTPRSADHPSSHLSIWMFCMKPLVSFCVSRP
jgi:hypothetical protein